MVNHTSTLLKRVHLHTCVTTTEAPAFFPRLATGRESQLPPDTRDQDYTELLTRLFVWSGGQPLRLDRTEHARRQVHLSVMREDEPVIDWAWWVNSTNTFDEPLIVVTSRDGHWTAGLEFERAIWASANTGMIGPASTFSPSSAALNRVPAPPSAVRFGCGREARRSGAIARAAGLTGRPRPLAAPLLPRRDPCETQLRFTNPPTLVPGHRRGRLG
ncbi:MAG: hypothetical protein ACYDC1_02630 [Limisphaerales bacterium]